MVVTGDGSPVLGEFRNHDRANLAATMIDCSDPAVGHLDRGSCWVEASAMGILTRLAGSDMLEERVVEILQELIRRGRLSVIVPIKTPPCMVQANAREVTLKGANSYTISEIREDVLSGVSRKKKGGGGVEIHVNEQFRLLPEAEKKALEEDKKSAKSKSPILIIPGSTHSYACCSRFQ